MLYHSVKWMYHSGESCVMVKIPKSYYSDGLRVAADRYLRYTLMRLVFASRNPSNCPEDTNIQ